MDSDQQILTTQFLVLRKTPYQETSMVVAGLSPDHGQLHFLVRGARRVGKKQFPLVDLFRVLDVQFVPGRGDLYKWRSAELARDLGAVARNPQTFETTGWLAKLALANSAGHVPHPLFYASLVTGLARLAEAASGLVPLDAAISSARVGASLILLAESGELPHFDDPEQERRRRLLLRMAVGRAESPRMPEGVWERLDEWAVGLLKDADYRV